MTSFCILGWAISASEIPSRAVRTASLIRRQLPLTGQSASCEQPLSTLTHSVIAIGPSSAAMISAIEISSADRARL